MQTEVPVLPDIIGLLSKWFPANGFLKFIHRWDNIAYALLVVVFLSILAYFASKKQRLIPGRLQNAAELIVGGLDDFVCGIIGPQGRRYTPFIGTLFLYIIFMNLSGIIPFFKASTASWSTTLALALCVFFYVQYAALRQMGFLGYLDHLAGRPRGILAATIIFPIFIFLLHVITELIRPLSLSLRLRGNIWGDEVLIGALASFGLKGLILLFVNMLMVVLTAVIQAVVFAVLSTIYFALVLEQEEVVHSG